MPTSALSPVFAGLRAGLHLLFFGLLVFVAAAAVITPTPVTGATVALTTVLFVVYAAGAVLLRTGRTRWVRMVWLCTITALWVGLLLASPQAAYLVFPLFFLYLHLLGPLIGTLCVLAATVVAICALGVDGGWSIGGVVGPLVGAVVALLIGLGYDALERESRRREQLLQELLTTRGQLAATEREAGMLAERARLAREIHDTVAQGLSSIQLLLHAAERAAPAHPGTAHIVLARETAADNLTDTRQLIQQLSPPDLDHRGLGDALRSLAAGPWAAHNLDVSIHVADATPLPMPTQSALLRIAQGAIGNVIQHAHAHTATISLTHDQQHTRYTISDDGTGFTPGTLPPANTGSFGLRAIQQRVDQLGGTFRLNTRPGDGTTLIIDLPHENTA